MTFTKDELQFLDMYVIGTENKKDNRDSIYGKIVIKADKAKQLVTFTQFSSDINLYTELKKDVKEDFELVLPTLQACNLIKLVPSAMDVELIEDGIKFGTNKYSFDREEVVFPNIDKFVDLYNTSTDTLTLSDLQKLAYAKNYMGAYELNLDSVFLNNSYFVSKSSDVIASIKTSNAKELSYYFSKVLISLIGTFKLNTLELKKFISQDDTREETAFSACKIGNTYVFMMNKKYLIPDIFEERFSNLYNHTTKMVINKKVFLDSLSRVKLFTNGSLDNRLFLEASDFETMYMTTDALPKKDEDKQPSVIEKVDGVYDTELLNSPRAVSSISLFQVATELEGENVCIYISSDALIPVIRVEDEKESNFYIVRLSKI